MQGDDPPYLSVGTAVSAKYKGAFCEAKVSKVVRIVKCKVTYKMGLGNATVNDEQVKGPLRVGQLVQAKHPDRKEFIDATITKIQDCSQYTVVFDDGDITTLRRTALCLKSGRHFNESETLDQLPLTHPEHFGNPVMGGRRGRRSRQLKEDSSEGEVEEENEPDLELYSADTGKVVSVEASDKKRSKDNWFPGLIVMPSAQPTVRINVKDEFLVRSFKDGRYYTVPKKEVNEFKREMGAKVESSTLSEAVDKAIKFLDNDELPVHWERNSLFNVQSQYSDSDENFSDSSDDEPTEEKDHFVAQLYKFMDDSGTPLNKTPMISNKDVDFYRLFRLVHKLGGYNRVTNQNKWKTIAIRLKFSQSQNTYNQVKQVYKKCLLSYESFYRTLGCTMLNHTRNSKKNRGRNLIRDKDRVTPVQSPRPERDEEEVKKEEEKEKEKEKEKDIKDKKKKSSEEDKKESGESSSELTDNSSEQQPSTSKETVKPKKVVEVKVKEKKRTSSVTEKVKVDDTKKEKEKEKEEEKEKEKDKSSVQQTRSKTNISKSKEVVSPESAVSRSKTPVKETQAKVPAKPVPKKIVEDEKDKDKKRGRKRLNVDDKTSNSDSSVNESSTPTPSSSTIQSSQNQVNIGDKLKVYYGPTHESKVTYEAKVIDVDNEPHPNTAYLVHYTGWNTRYDEWITLGRIAENLSATTKAKRLKQGNSGSKGNKVIPGKRGRGMSITGRSTIPEVPRSSTPSSVTSSSSRTKSPATPASRSGNRSTRQGDATNRRTRRTSAQTDISIHSESESDEQSESDTELTRTRSGSKTDDVEPKTYRRKLVKTKGDKRKDDEDTEKEEDVERPKRARKLKKPSDVAPLEDSDDDSSSQPKGREFDLNQIRSELKGFGKAIKVPSTESSEKENASSDSESTVVDLKECPEIEAEDKKEKEKEKEDKCSSSEDIYEFKEPEPFEFEARKSDGDKGKKRIPRLFEDLEKTPPKKQSPNQEVKKFTAKKILMKKEEEISSPEIKEEKSLEDPFDMLVESPSFHIGKSTTITKETVVEKPVMKMHMFELQEEDSEDRMGLSSDNDDFTRNSSPFLSSNSPDRSETKMEVKTSKDSEDDVDRIRASIQRVIEQSSLNDEDSEDLLEQPSTAQFEVKASPEPKTSISVLVNRMESEDGFKEEVIEEKEKEKEKVVVLPKQIASVFQETDSSFLEDLCSAPPQFNTAKVDDIKEISLKTGTRIADTLLQKFSMIKSIEKSPEPEVKEEEPVEVKQEEKPEVKEEPAITTPMMSLIKNITTSTVNVMKPEEELKTIEANQTETKPKLEVKKPESPLDFKKRQASKKFVSREFIEDTDTESDSDSEQRLVIARSDDDSQTSISLDNNKTEDVKESDSNITLYPHTEDSQSQEEERNFKFDNLPVKIEEVEEVKKEEEITGDDLKCEETEIKEEEPDSQLHSMLLCRETIPGSPAPPPQNDTAQTTKPAKPKNVLEMPFASAPSSSSNNKNNSMLQQEKIKEKQPSPPPLVIPLDNSKDASTVLDNTPPTTPESTISNLSPRGDVGGLSPNIADNESCKSADADVDYPPSNMRRSICSKIGNYSDDSLTNNDPPMMNQKRPREEIPSPCKKRRRSCKGDSDVPTKRGRKPNRSRHNSDSDDTSEHSMQGINLETRLTRSSPRPSKYNFFVELDPSLDSAARIAVLQQKLQDLRKTYADVKAELVTIERRRKKIRRREREALKAAKQEMACT